MAGFLDQFRKKVISSVWKNNIAVPAVKNIDDKIALGVLLWVVAEADEKFLPEEEAKIKEVLKTHSKIKDSDLPVVINAISEAAKERIDLHTFSREITKDLSYDIKVSIIEDLFRVACADRDLDNNEIEVIRKISGLFRLEHKDFIDAKIKVKKEFGLDTAGL